MPAYPQAGVRVTTAEQISLYSLLGTRFLFFFEFRMGSAYLHQADQMTRRGEEEKFVFFGVCVVFFSLTVWALTSFWMTSPDCLDLLGEPFGSLLAHCTA